MRFNALFLAVFLASCASKMSESDCAGADWSSLGERDGLYGEGEEKLSERAAQCADYGVAADAAAYQAGRSKGLASYCTPDAGFDAGRNGRAYRGVCPPEAESAFLAEYETGRRLYDLTEAVNSAERAYESALETLKSSQYDLRDAIDRYNDGSLSEDERRKAGRNVDRLRRDIDRLEDDLPRLEREIRNADGELADYRAFLDRRRR
jgi:hypothetical protein